VHDRLLLYVVVAAVAGTVLPERAMALSGLVPLFLAGQVGGVALTITGRQLVRAVRSPLPLVISLVLMWSAVPLIGLGLAHLSVDRTVAAGIIITAAVPAEITSPLVAILAGGVGAVAITTVVASLAVGTVLTPLWLALSLGPGVHVDQVALITELAVSVSLPLVVAVVLRTRFDALARYGAAALDLAAISVVLVVFVAAGYARELSGWRAAAGAAVLALALQTGGYVLGWGASRALRFPRAVTRAVVFPIGMREFGIATAVALETAPSAAGVAGLYGVILMVSAPVLAGVMKPRR
jgi:BASS family bile acid:Na+ symporter